VRWDIVNNEKEYFRIVRKGRSNIEIYVISTLNKNMSREELIEFEKKAMVADCGKRSCVYKNPLAETNPAIAGLHFIIDEGESTEQEALVDVGTGKSGAFVIALIVPKLPANDWDSDPENPIKSQFRGRRWCQSPAG
jgi:hypothetical protein